MLIYFFAFMTHCQSCCFLKDTGLAPAYLWGKEGVIGPADQLGHGCKLPAEPATVIGGERQGRGKRGLPEEAYVSLELLQGLRHSLLMEEQRHNLQGSMSSFSFILKRATCLGDT